MLSACASTGPQSYNFFLHEQIDNLDTLPLSQEIPLPGEYISGEYDNGLSYYIRNNPQPADRVEIRLVLRAGSLLEEDGQQGFAHFVEHMAFNGTEDFSQEELLQFVESTGMSLGSHLNAFTGFDNTFYVLELPSNDNEVLETGIRIIENWAHKLQFDPTEIQKERGVVLEEWRAGKNVNERLSMKHLEKTIAGSRWVERFPIGQPDIIQNGNEEDLIAYYKKWYRPDLMSVIVIGDVDLLSVAQLLDTHIGTIPGREDALDADALYADFTIADNKEPIISIETDNELATTQFALMTTHPKMPVKTFEDLRRQYLIGLHTTMMNFRLHEKVVTQDFPTLNVDISFDEYFKFKEAYSFIAGAKTGQTKEAIRAVLTEAYRIKQNGFTESELARAKQSWLSDFKQQAQTMFSDVSTSHANRLLSLIVNDYPILDADDAYVFAQRVLPTITLDEVNNIGKDWLSDENRIIKVSAPENETASLPSADEIIAIWDDVANTSFTAFVDNEVPDTLMTATPEPGSVVNKDYDSSDDFHKWTLSNGATVILKQTELVTGQINFRTYSPGGTSLLDDDRYNRTRMTPQIMDSMGVADYDYITMAKFLSDKSFNIVSSIDPFNEWMTSDFTVQDINSFMQLLHLKFTQARYDEANFNNYMAYVRPQLVNQFNSPEAKYSEAVRSALFGDSVRNRAFDLDMLDLQSLPDMYALYKERFANAADFTFVFVGDFSLEEIEPLLNTYIATLPSTEGRETHRILPDERTNGELLIEVNENTEQRAEVYLEYRGSTEFSHVEELSFYALLNALDIKLRQKVREEKSAVYSVNVGGMISQLPSAEFNLNISFSSDPNRVDEIISDIESTLEDIKTQALEPRFIKNFIAQHKEQFALNVKTNTYWGYYLVRLDTNEKPLLHSEYDEALNSVTAEKVLDVAQKYLATEHTMKAIMMPKN